MLVLLLLGLLQSTPRSSAGFGVELIGRNLPLPPDASDLEQPITGYFVLDDERGFVIAYYTLQADNSLHELRIRSFDKRTQVWRSKTFPEPIGSVLKVQRNAGYLYVTGHSSPSATPLLVLKEDLELKRELDGWPVLMLDTGQVIFNRSMRHFAPTHAEALALYDPAADREWSVYPPSAITNDRGAETVSGTDLWMERSVMQVKKGRRAGTIEFTTVEQRMRLDRDQPAQPSAPKQWRLVVCNVVARPVVCDSRAQTPPVIRPPSEPK